MQKLFNYIHKEKITHLNPILADGYSTLALHNAIAHIDAYTRCGLSILEGTDLEYVGFVQATPEEMYDELVKKTSTRPPTFDVSRSDLYMTKMHWRFHGSDIYHPIFLIFSKDNITYLRGSAFGIFPVLIDRSFSIGHNELFFPFTRARIKFLKVPHERLMVTGSGCQLVSDAVIYGPNIYNRSKDSLRKQGTPQWKARTTLAHYLFCHKGVVGAFKHYANVDVIVGDSKTISVDSLNMNEWVYFESANVKPADFGRFREYFKPDLRIAVRREELTPGVDGLINGLFYVADNFPEMVNIKYVGTQHEATMWAQIMGNVIFPTNVNPGKLLEDMAPHFESLKDYVDAEVIIKLQSDGIYCNDFYELCYYILDNFDSMIVEGIDKVSSMYDKKIEVLKYVLTPITSSIFKFIFNIKKGKGTLTPETVAVRLGKFVKPKEIFSINHGHGEITSAAGLTSSDCKALRGTSALVAQTSSSGPNAKSKMSLTDPTQHLDVSFAELGQFAAITKSDPSGKGFINLTAKVDHKGHLLRDPELLDLTTKVQNTIKR